MNRHKHHNIWNRIMWGQTSHNTCTCMATLCVIELWTHQKLESFKKNPQRLKSNSNLLINSEKHPKSFELVSGRMVLWNTTVFDISWIHLWTGGRSGLPVPIYTFRWTSPRSSQFWVANHDILSLERNDREILSNSLWYISSSHCGPQFLPCRAPRSRSFLTT